MKRTSARPVGSSNGKSTLPLGANEAGCRRRPRHQPPALVGRDIVLLDRRFDRRFSVWLIVYDADELLPENESTSTAESARAR